MTEVVCGGWDSVVFLKCDILIDMNIEDFKKFFEEIFLCLVSGIIGFCLADIRARIKRIEKHLGIKDDSREDGL